MTIWNSHYHQTELGDPGGGLDNLLRRCHGNVVNLGRGHAASATVVHFLPAHSSRGVRCVIVSEHEGDEPPADLALIGAILCRLAQMPFLKADASYEQADRCCDDQKIPVREIRR